jgi:hypothetical protein
MTGIGRINSSNNLLNGRDLSHAETNYGGLHQPQSNAMQARSNTLKIKEKKILILEDLEGEISL